MIAYAWLALYGAVRQKERAELALSANRGHAHWSSMTRRTLAWLCGFWALLGGYGCEGDEPRAASGRDGGTIGVRGEDGGRPRPGPGSASDQPLLCAGCDRQSMPGGDTSDFGAGMSP